MEIPDLGRFVDSVRDLVERWTLPDADWYPAPWFRGHGDANWVLMQHYGLPTRLLDRTESSLIGLYFALRDNRGDCDAAVWVLNPWWLNKQSLGEYDIPPAGDSRVAEWAPLGEGKILQAGLPVAIKPIHASPRISVQKGFFTIHGAERGALDRLSNSRAYRGTGASEADDSQGACSGNAARLGGCRDRRDDCLSRAGWALPRGQVRLPWVLRVGNGEDALRTESGFGSDITPLTKRGA